MCISVCNLSGMWRIRSLVFFRVFEAQICYGFLIVYVLISFVWCCKCFLFVFEDFFGLIFEMLF